MNICETCDWDEKLLLCCPCFPETGERAGYTLPGGRIVAACVYLDASGLCSIYDSRPERCRRFECDRMLTSSRDMRLSDESMPSCLRMMRDEP